MSDVFWQAHTKIAELRENKALFTNIKVSFRWTPQEGEMTSFESFPPEAAIKAAAMDIRIFLQPGTPFIMGSLVKKIRERPDTDHEKLDKFYAAWRLHAGEKPSDSAPMGIALNMDGKDLTLKEQIDLWMNGRLFHIDTEKAAKLDRMYFSSFRDQSWMIFVSTLQNLAGLLFYFDKQFLQVDNERHRIPSKPRNRAQRN